MRFANPMTCGLLLLVLSLPANAEVLAITAAEWSRPRTGERVRALPAVNAAVTAWLENPQARLVLRHASGEEGSLWAAELKDWLIALGVSADRIEIQPAGSRADRLELEVIS